MNQTLKQLADDLRRLLGGHAAFAIANALDDLHRIRSVTIEGAAEIEKRHAETAAKIAEARRVFAETADCRTQEEGKQNSIAYQTAYWADSEAHRDRATLLDVVRRCEADRAHLYTECCDAAETSAQHLRDLHAARAEIERLKQELLAQRASSDAVILDYVQQHSATATHAGLLSRKVESLQRERDALAAIICEAAPFAWLEHPSGIELADQWQKRAEAALRKHGHLADRDSEPAQKEGYPGGRNHVEGVVCVGWDGVSRPIYRLRAELGLPDHQQRRVGPDGADLPGGLPGARPDV